jgi:hypothetical protein
MKLECGAQTITGATLVSAGWPTTFILWNPLKNAIARPEYIIAL